MIVRTRSGDMEYRSSLGTLLSQYGLGRVGYGASAGVPVTTLTVAGIPAVHAAVTFAAEAVAVLPMSVWRGEGSTRQKATTIWQSRLFRGVPNEQQTWYDFWEAVQASLDFRGNAYIWKSKDASGKVVALYALHPDQVYLNRETVTKKILYRVAFGAQYPTPPEASVYKSVTVDKSTMLHIRGRGGTGELIGPSPITLFRSALGIAVAKQQHEANLYERGAANGGLVVSFPAGITKRQADEWREDFDSTHAGTQNAGKTKVVGSGATVTTIGMTQEDVQFVESIGLTIQDVSRIFRVPGWFLGVSDKTEKPMSPEHEQQRWVKHGLLPRLTRIEAAINADPDLFGGNSGLCAAFDTSGLIRGDLTTEDTIAHQQIQDGRLLVDEWRIQNGRSPLPGGVGMIPQITPVGGAPNPNTQGGNNSGS